MFALKKNLRSRNMPTWICDRNHVKDPSHLKQTKRLVTIEIEMKRSEHYWLPVFVECPPLGAGV